MTQVITVSPMTAAYASEAYKPRDTRYSPMEKAISEWHAHALESGDAYDRGLLNVVRPPSLQLAFLTAAQHSYRHVSLDQAIAEYASMDGSKQPIEEASDAAPEVHGQEVTTPEPNFPAAPVEAEAAPAPAETAPAAPAPETTVSTSSSSTV